MNLRSTRLEILVSILIIGLITFITHGMQLANLGYYRDDWYLLWNGYTQGYESIAPIFFGDRPLMGILYSWIYHFLGNEAKNWHVYAFVLKLGGALAFFWLLRMIWPKRYFATTAATLIFIVYPGFLQQPNANTFQNHLFGYLFAILSIGFTIRAIQTTRPWKTILLSLLAVLFQFIYLNIYEYMIGLEGVRYVFIWYITFREDDDPFLVKFQTFLKRLVIYIPVVLGVIYWRVFVFESTRQAMNMSSLLSEYSSSRLRGLFYLGVDFSVDMIEALFSAWIVPLYGFLRGATYRNIGLSVLYALIAGGLLYIYYVFVNRRELLSQDQESSNKSIIFLWMGLLATLLTIAPVVLAGRNIYFNNQFDRYTLQATLGISLFTIGFIFYGLRLNIRMFTMILLVFVGVITHYHNITYHREFWQLQRELWWQLSWRAPDLLDDTVLVALLPPGFRLAESYEIWGPANIIYRPESEELKIPAEVLNRGTAQNILRNISDDREQRGAEIIRDFNNILLLSMPSTLNCVNIIDGQKYELSQSEDLLVAQVAPYSQIERIDTSAISHIPAVSIFGPEPDHTWCYYYQKMSLARQDSDWEKVSRLADEAREKGYKPLDLSEWVPVYEGYANTDRKKDARNISRILRSDKDLQYNICSQLEKWSDIPDDYNYDLIHGELCLKK